MKLEYSGHSEISIRRFFIGDPRKQLWIRENDNCRGRNLEFVQEENEWRVQESNTTGNNKSMFQSIFHLIWSARLTS
jgi:hypothetical protein